MLFRTNVHFIIAMAAQMAIANAATIKEFNEDFERRLASRAREVFDTLTPEKIASAVPLELTLDETPYVRHDKSRLRRKKSHGKKHNKRNKHKAHNRQLKDKSKEEKSVDDESNASSYTTHIPSQKPSFTPSVSQPKPRPSMKPSASPSLLPSKTPSSRPSLDQSESRDTTNEKQNRSNSKNENKNNPNEMSDSTKIDEVVDDSEWPHSGPIQSATGRILFQFSSNQIYKCSGTVIQDNTTGRSIVLTAAHCAYNDLSKEFASMAIFIPDQDATRGSKSDFNCQNDVYGCWLLSFAVVERGWTEGSFPHNIGYDYAFYVVHDRSSSHRGGYGENITGERISIILVCPSFMDLILTSTKYYYVPYFAQGILDEDVTPLQIDFEYKLKNDFTVALGYSDEKDPSFQYCSNKLGTINGIDEYTNFWLDNCGLHGGASGGPWTVDMDDSGVGTVVSLSSWGYSSSSGVAGPNLRTESGSSAECLLEKAMYAADPGSVGGYIVDC